MSVDDDMRAAVDERLAETLRKNRERRDTRRRQLAELAERRAHGLRARHRNKLGRTQRKEPAMADDTRHATAHRRSSTLSPDEIHTTNLPGGAAVEINMVDQEITVTGPRGVWKIRDRRGKDNT